MGLFVAKNVILSGVKSVTITDTVKTSIADLTTQVWYLILNSLVNCLVT